MSLQGVKLHLIETIDDVLKFHEWLGERRPYHALAFDTETTGLKVGKDIVRLAQIGDGQHGWVMPWHGDVGVRGAFIGGWSGLFADVVKRWDGDWIAHNAKFDTGMLDHMRVKMPRSRVRDTRIMSHILTPQYSTALKNVAARLVDASAGGLQAELKDANWTWDTVPLDYPPYWTYAGLDPVLTYRIYEVLWPKVQRECLEAFNLENEVSWIIERMERYGAHIDVEYTKTKLEQFEAFVREAAAWVKSEYGISAGSNVEVIRVLSEAGYTFTKATKSGAIALDKEVLEGVDHPLAEIILKRRRLQKLASTYLKHFAYEVDENDLIHPSVNVLGARTSRMSMQDPNLQNLPRKSNSNPAADAVRECVTRRPGHMMLMCDFDQVEMRGLASMSRDEAMIAAFLSPNDFFVELAKLVYDDETIVKADPRRQVVKNAGYATIYGAGVEKFSATAGITVEQGGAVRRRWVELFPQVAAFQNEVVRIATQRRESDGVSYVRCPMTRRFQVADPGKEYVLVNYLIQGWAASLFKRKLIELDNAGLGDWMVAPVHDEIVLDVPEEHVEDAAATLKKVMNDLEIAAPVPITASVSWGTSWGSKEAYE